MIEKMRRERVAELMRMHMANASARGSFSHHVVDRPRCHRLVFYRPWARSELAGRQVCEFCLCFFARQFGVQAETNHARAKSQSAVTAEFVIVLPRSDPISGKLPTLAWQTVPR